MDDDIKNACEVLWEGGLILYPTDTVWGIGCDATNEKAVQKIYDLKRRIDSKAMLVLIDNPSKLTAYVDEIPDTAWDLIEVTDKPLTIVYSNAKNLAENLIANDGSIGIRVTHEAFSKTLCEAFRKPLVSTSANVSGEPTPANFSEIQGIVKAGVDFIVNYRRNDMNKVKPSSVIKLRADRTFQIIRP